MGTTVRDNTASKLFSAQDVSSSPTGSSVEHIYPGLVEAQVEVTTDLGGTGVVQVIVEGSEDGSTFVTLGSSADIPVTLNDGDKVQFQVYVPYRYVRGRIIETSATGNVDVTLLPAQTERKNPQPGTNASTNAG